MLTVRRSYFTATGREKKRRGEREDDEGSVSTDAR